jgi:hypothetical protein
MALQLQQDHLIAVGHVAVRAALLDKMLELTASQIIHRYPPILRKEAERFSIPKKIELIRDSFSADMKEHKNAIAEFISEVFAAREERNDIIHRIWRVTDSAETLDLVEVRHEQPERTVRRVNAKGMLALADQMVDLAYELADWKMFCNAHLDYRLRRAAKRLSHKVQPPIPPRTSSRDKGRPE